MRPDRAAQNLPDIEAERGARHGDREKSENVLHSTRFIGVQPMTASGQG
jgi:hypothetical protein